MMRLKTTTAALGAALLAGSVIGSVHAAPLENLVSGGQLNTFQDDSREVLFDVDGDNRYSVGDVNAGILRINERVTPGGLPLFGADELIVAFSIQVVDITGDIITWGPTTSAAAVAAGLDVASLIEAFVPGGFPAQVGVGSPIGAVFTDVGFNPITTPASTTGDLNGDGDTDYMDTIARVAANGSLELVVGMNGIDDFFRGDLTIDPTLFALTTLASVGTSFSVGIFGAGLSILSNSSAASFDRQVCAGIVPGDPNVIPPPACIPVSTLLPGTLHDVTVGNGTLSGGNNVAIAGDLFGTFNGVAFFGLTNRAEVSVAPVPEPGVLMLLSLGLLALPASARLRRRQAS